MKILSKQNFNQNESKNFVVDNLSSAPSNPILGQVYYNTQNERAYVCIKSGETPEWADLSLQEEVSIGGEEPNGRDVKIWIDPEDMGSITGYESMPLGSIVPYAGTTPPEGFLICDGAEIDRETYKELFKIIGTTYGSGDNSTTFNVPNIKGKTVVGLDSEDTDFNTIGKTGGSKELQEHTHAQNSFNSWGAGVNITHLPVDAVAGITVSNQAYMGNRHTLSAGTGDSGNLQPYITLNYIIRAISTTMLTGDVIDSLEGDSSYNAPSIHAVNTKIKELVAPDYDGLPVGSEFDYDGTEIPDGFVQIDDPTSYSNNETVIGTWFGKKLYRKTFYRQSLINGADEIVNHGIQNVDKMWVNPSKSFAIWPSGIINNIPFLHPDNYNDGIFVSDFSSTSYRIKSGMDRRNISGYITLEYTKTTD